jgi:hypothetical protein
MTFPCDVCSCEAEVMTSIKDKCFWNLKLLSRNADHLARKLAEVITNKEGKVWYIKESLICMNRSYVTQLKKTK